MSTIGAALSSFNALKDIAQAMVSLHDTQAFQMKVIEFNGKRHAETILTAMV